MTSRPIKGRRLNTERSIVLVMLEDLLVWVVSLSRQLGEQDQNSENGQ